MHAAMLPPYNPVINEGGTLEKRIINRGNCPKHESTAMKQKVRILKMKFESNTNKVVEDMDDHTNVCIATIWESLDLQPEKFSEGELINMTEKSDCDKKKDDTPQSMTLGRVY